MWKGIEAVRPGARVYDIGRAIQEHAERYGFGVVRAFVGHGIGTEFHTAPSIPHYYDRYADTVLEPGMLFTIEPMITEGSWELGRIWPDGWTAPTRDGSRCAQFEHTVMVTGTGVEVLTLLPERGPRPRVRRLRLTAARLTPCGPPLRACSDLALLGPDRCKHGRTGDWHDPRRENDSR